MSNQTNEVILKTLPSFSRVTLNGVEVYSGGRVTAKKIANAYAKDNGLTEWVNIKRSGAKTTVAVK